MTRAKSCCFIQDKIQTKKNSKEKREGRLSPSEIQGSHFSHGFFFFLLMLTKVLSQKFKLESLLGQSRSCAQKLTRVIANNRQTARGAMGCNTGKSKNSFSFSGYWLLIGQKNKKVSWYQSETRTAVTVQNWSGKTLSPGALLAVLYFSLCHTYTFPTVQTFPRPLYLPLGLRGWLFADSPF